MNIEKKLFPPRFLALLLALATVAVYLPALHNGFVNFDDDDYVTANHQVQAGLTWDGVRWAFTTFYAANWHPLTWLSHMTDCTLFGLNPAAHHFVNILIHAANAALLFLLWLRLTGSIWASAWVAALFAWHPLHVESVAWVSERKDVLSTFLALLALLGYADYVRANHRRSYWLAFLCFCLSLMAKPMFVTLPFLLLLLDVWPLERASLGNFDGRAWNRLVREKIALLVPVVASAMVTYLAQRTEAVRTLQQVPVSLRLENALAAMVTYLGQIAYPVGLTVFYPLPDKIPWLITFTAGATLLLITVLVWTQRKKTPCLTVGWLWFLGTLIPVIGLVQVGDAAHADRYLYFPAIGIFIAVAFSARDWAANLPFLKKIFATTAILVLSVCIALTENQIRFWHDSETLFRRALAVTDHNATAHLNLGSALQAKGKTAEAVAEYRAALELDPKLFEADSNLGKLLFEQGNFAAALPWCELAVRLKPDRAALHNNLGLVLAALGRFDEALVQFDQATRLNKTYAIPHFQSGRILLKQGHGIEAVSQLFTALQLDPDNVQFLLFTARVLASHENSKVRDGATSYALAQHASQLAGPPQPAVLDTLAMSLAELGRFTEAQAAQAQAIELAGENHDQEDLAAMRIRLALYQSQKAWRESYLAAPLPAKN